MWTQSMGRSGRTDLEGLVCLKLPDRGGGGRWTMRSYFGNGREESGSWSPQGVHVSSDVMMGRQAE